MTETLVIGAYVLALYRNWLAFSWRNRMLTEASERSRAAIDSGDFAWRRFYDALPGYFALMFDLTTWRYRSPFAAAAEGA